MPSRKRRRKKRRALRILVVVLGMLAVVGLVAGTLWLIVVQLDKLALWPFGQSETASSTAPPTVLTTTGAPPAQTTIAAATATTTTTRPKTTTRGPAATVDAQELNRKLDDILNKNGRTPKAIYDYVHGHMTYKTMARGSSYEEMALYAIKYGKGSCYQFTALTYLLLKRAGYDAYYIDGNGWQGGGPHTWVMAHFDGGWYFIDSVYVRSAKLTRADLIRIGYKWDESPYPPSA